MAEATDSGASQSAQQILDKLSTTKRFVLPKEARFKSRLDTLKTSFKEIRSLYPEFVGLTVYGSMIKDMAREESDIDGYLFVDADLAKQKLTEEDWIAARQDSEDYKRKGIHPPSLLDMAITNRYKAAFHNDLIAGGLTKAQVADLRVRGISQEIIDKEMSRLINEKRRVLGWEKASEIYIANPDGNRPKYPKNHIVSSNIYGMFHLAIGAGLDRYRKMVLTTLRDAGEAGEKGWLEIISITADMERYMRGSNYPQLFPHTIETALDYYRVR